GSPVVLGASDWPDANLLATGKVQEGGGMRQRQPVGRHHRVHLDARLRPLQRPGRVVDLAAVDAAPRAYGIETVALGQPVVEGARGGSEDRTRRAVPGDEVGAG